MWNVQDATNVTVASMDPLGDAYELYKLQFDQRYEGNRAPLGIFIHAAWIIADPRCVVGGGGEGERKGSLPPFYLCPLVCQPQDAWQPAGLPARRLPRRTTTPAPPPPMQPRRDGEPVP
jgi:hypothetical protein